jgi:ferredoxin-NADP reductase
MSGRVARKAASISALPHHPARAAPTRAPAVEIAALPVHFPLKLVSSRMLAPSVRHLVFQRDDGQPLDFIPGQFVQVHFHYADGSATKRSYSLATIHDHALGAGETVEIAVSYVVGGAATALFENLAEGDRIEASGPYGRFCLMPADSNRRYLLIATGTGVTPYRAMLPQLEQLIATRGVEVVLLFGARTTQELLYADDFTAFAARQPAFRFVPCFSRELPADASPDARRGYVQDQLDAFAPDPTRDIAYLCGNPNMVDACFERFKQAGFAVPQVRREKYVSSK